jgi:hypothetical protein
MLVILRGVVYCLFFEFFYSSLCISYALTHPLLQVQSLVEKSKLSKSRQYSAIKSCMYAWWRSVSNMRCAHFRDRPKTCPIHGPKNNL